MPDSNYITKAEFKQYETRIDANISRIDSDVARVEKMANKIDELATTTAILAENMKGLLDAQNEQNERLKALEGRDGEMWRKLVWCVISVAVGCIIGFIFTKAGISS